VIARGAARVLAAATLLATPLVLPARPAAAATDVRFRGLLQLAAAPRGAAFEDNVRTWADGAFDPAQVRLFADVRVDERVQVFVQGVLDDASGPYLDGAYALFTPLPQRDLHVLAGKLPWAIGTWAPRTYADHNPLVGTPLLYSRHTALSWAALPAGVDGLLADAGHGKALGYAFGSMGMPIVDDSYWDVGVTLTGSERPLEYAVGVTAGTPGWASVHEDDNHGRTVLGRIGVAPLPGLRAGVSGARGPYLGAWLQPALPAGRRVEDYDQRLLMADVEWVAGHFELRSEGARNEWQTPFAGTLGVDAGYVEARLAAPWGAYAAVRADAMRFGDVTDTAGDRRAWDADTDRLEAGGGWRFTRAVTGKLVWQRTWIDATTTARSRRLELFAAQLVVAF